jgi:Amt family ammonium transporter
VFLAHMSHEIRTPLNGVSGMLDLLETGAIPERERRYASLARRSADSLTTVINDILDFSKIEAGKLEITPAPFSLQELVDEVMAMLAAKATEKGLELLCLTDRRVPRIVEADSDRVRQVLVNLVSNAIKFTEHGQVVLRVTVDSESHDRCQIRFAVSDTGIGISPDQMERLFRAFSQADAATTRVYGGTGLGLAISKQLAELMGGMIGVESAAGVGSTFWFTIAAVLPEAAREPGPASLEPRELRVLAVTDSEVQRENLRAQLGNWGIHADVAPDGETALRMLAAGADGSHRYHVAIVDGDMSGMSGIDLAGAIKADPNISSTVLMALVSVTTYYDPELLRALGFAGHLTKPVRQSQLFNAIMQALAASTRTEASTLSAEPGPVAAPDAVPMGLRVLLAEDNEVNQFVASELLRKLGIECCAVATGVAAIEAVQREAFDLVLMDCQMPELDGLDATREIRRLEQRGGVIGGRRGRLPIVALTANAMKGDREQCLKAGMDAYLSKPIQPGLLAETIRAVIRTTRTDDPAAKESRCAPVEPATLLDRCMGDGAVAILLLTKLESQILHDLEAIGAALPKQDCESVARVAHALKGAAGAVAAEPIREIAARIEIAARSGAFADAERDLETLRDEVRRCIEYLPTARAHIASAGAPAGPTDGGAS